MMLLMASPSLLPVSPAHGSFAAAATRCTARAHPLTMMAKLENAETKNAETKNAEADRATGTLSSKVASAGFVPARTFGRAGDVFGMGETVSEVDIVNVLGRWATYKEWDTIGPLEEMNQLFDSEGNLVDGPALKRAWARWEAAYEGMAVEFKDAEFKATQLPTWMRTSEGPIRDPAWGEPRTGAGTDPTACQSPQRRQFCIKRGQVQRWWHGENVKLLPFRSEALAASVGSTAAELSAKEINPLACEVVFDALSRSESGILDKTLVDERKAAYEAPDGSFDADAFAADLREARKTFMIAKAIWPGSINAIFAIAFFRGGGPEIVSEYVSKVVTTLAGQF